MLVQEDQEPLGKETLEVMGRMLEVVVAVPVRPELKVVVALAVLLLVVPVELGYFLLLVEWLLVTLAAAAAVRMMVLQVQVQLLLAVLTGALERQGALPRLTAQLILAAVEVEAPHYKTTAEMAAQESLSFPTQVHNAAQAAQSHHLVATLFTPSHHPAHTQHNYGHARTI
jgi:hypothetical protein